MTQINSKRELILEAAGRVTLQWGASAMTLDAVAKQAGVSKGGLLYHFSSKEALIEGMIGRLIEEFDAAIEREMAMDAAEGVNGVAGRWLRAYVRVNTMPQDETEAVFYSLMAAFASNPKMLEPAQRAFERWQHQAENDGVPVEIATVVRLAADGCWLCRLFGLGAGIDATHQLPALRQEMLRLIEQSIEGAAKARRGE